MADDKKTPAFDPTKVKIVKNVTLPVLSLKAGQVVFVVIDTAIEKGKELKRTAAADGKEPEVKQEPADICHVTNLETGEQLQFIVNAVVKANLDEAYPKNGYVGKRFRVAKLEKRAGKRYFDFNIAEIA